MNLLVISCSLNPESRSAILAHRALQALEGVRDLASDGLNLLDHTLPPCDGTSAFADPSVGKVADIIREADGIIVATPVYNYSVNAATKNLLELTGEAWSGKVVGFLCAAGGHSSYMAVMSFANSLMLDYRCLIVPRFVYSDGSAFANGQLIDEEIGNRVDQLALETARLVRALRTSPDAS